MPTRRTSKPVKKRAAPKRAAKSAAKVPKARRPAPSARKAAPKSAPKRPAKKTAKPAGKYPDIRRDLQRQRAALLREAGVALTNRAEFETFPDLSDQASAEMDQNFLLRLKDRERKLIKKIDEALDRMSHNVYGICESCGGDIPYKRLKARPVTTLCIDCKTLQEQEELIRR
ncbi:MAG: RNA polymerase-binding protein DksA [Nitrospirae bacterium]|nr:MAG: RNA polymerase-binding protein DksA [Nitrospirota bacterium]